MKAEKYLCVRDFKVGYGGKISGYERELTDVCENFRMEGGTLCDLYGVERIVSLPTLPTCVYPLPYESFGGGVWLYRDGSEVCLYQEETQKEERLHFTPYGNRFSAGERKGKSVIAFPCTSGLRIVGPGEDTLAEVTEVNLFPAVDVVFWQGRWVILGNTGSICMTKPYSDEKDGLTELTPPTLGKVRRIAVSEGKLMLFTSRALYVLSGFGADSFVLSAVSVPETVIFDSIATDGNTLYFLTEKSVFSYRGGNLERVYRLPFAFLVEGETSAIVKDGAYYFACATERGKREGLFDPAEKGVFLGAGRGITSFADLETENGGVIAVTYGRKSIGRVTDACAVDGAPLPKIWRSRPTDFGRLNAYKILTSIAVWAKGKGRLRVQSERGASVLPLTDGDNAKRLTLTGVRFVMEISSADPSARFVKPVITFTEGGNV